MPLHFGRFALWIVILVASSSLLAQEASNTSRLFDMGPADGELAEGYQRIQANSLYSSERGFGWEALAQSEYSIPRPDKNPAWEQPAGQEVPEDYLIFQEHSPLTSDGVASASDLVFRVDLPAGEYRVSMVLGRLDRPICSLQVFLNESQVAHDFDAKHWKSRRRPDCQYGMPRSLRRTVTVHDGILRVRIQGDDSKFKQRFYQEYDKPGLGSYLEATYFDGVYREGRKLGIDAFAGAVKPPRDSLDRWGTPPFHVCRVWAWEDIGGPFTENAICALEVYPFIPEPLEWRDQQLVAMWDDVHLQNGVSEFNAKQWVAAEAAFERVNDPYAKALGYLWLAGRPEYEEEQRLLPLACELLQAIAPSRQGDAAFQHHYRSAQRMAKAIDRFVNRGKQQRSYTELILVTGEVNSFQPEDPLYYKSRIYAGRAMYMIIPHRWTYAAGVGRQYFEELRQAGFADNRFVRWFLNDEWTSQAPDWIFPDYSAKKTAVPPWAGEVYEAYNREIDLAEWWIKNRQAPDGSLGGGWGDDVEILRSIGAFASICPDASPLLVNGIRKLADGVWHSGSIDQQAGFFAEVDDSEHGAEWTADTLPLMLQMDYGNPLYVERAMLTAKLMRDIWMDYADAGHRLMRSNFLGATGVGAAGTTNDSRINFRATAPARAVLAYNRLESLQAIYLEWAEAWWTAAMSTARSKPKGIIPQEIGFPSETIGGERSPNWYTAEKLPASENYDWEGVGGYHFYVADLLLLAYELSGDRKYLEPLELQAEFVEQYLPEAVRNSQYVRSGRLHPELWESLEVGSAAWIAARMATWPATWDAMRRRIGGRSAVEQSESACLEQATAAAMAENDGARRRWPHTTTEAMATDRVHFPNMGNAMRLMTGYIEGQGPSVTYQGLGREFAAVVLQADAANVRVVVFCMDDQARQGLLVPWVLKQGDEYELQIFADDNHDALPDRLLDSQRWVYHSAGQAVPFTLAGKSQLVLELRRIASHTSSPLLADVAVTAADIRFLSEFGVIDVAIHNIGAVPARRLVVALRDEQGQEIGRQMLPHLTAPTSFDAQIARISFPFDGGQAAGRKFTVVLDPDQNLSEITTVNNLATALCPEGLPPRKIHSHP